MCPPPDLPKPVPEAHPDASGKPARRGLRGALWLVGWPARMLLIGLVKFYRVAISPWTPPTCRYQPTCSQYALQAVRRYGAARGFVLALWRIARCHPWGGHGYDPPRWFGEPRPDPHPS